jgi:hypothetical protein
MMDVGLAEVQIDDTFDNGSLAINETEGGVVFDDILGSVESDFASVASAGKQKTHNPANRSITTGVKRTGYPEKKFNK